MTIIFGGQGVSPTLRGQASNVFALQAGQVRLIPAGTWRVTTGNLTCIQEFDPITGIWRGIGNGPAETSTYVNSDGVNFRVANQSGCVVGAELTAAGSGYVVAPTITPSAGSAVFTVLLGGLVSTSVSVTNGGTNYIYPPQVFIDAPAAPGVQAVAKCAISAGSVTGVTIIDQGAGYTNVPNITFVNDPRDTTGGNASAVAALTGTGTVSAILVTDHGNPVANNSTTQPTLTVSTGSATALAIMNWTIQSYTVTSAGSGYVGSVEVVALGTGFPAAAAAYTNPTTQSRLVKTRRAEILGALATTALTATGQTVINGGIYSGSNVAGYVAGFATGSAALPAFTFGGGDDVVTILAN
jgi:hypothetical protein